VNDYLDPDHWVNGGEHESPHPDAIAMQSLDDECREVKAKLQNIYHPKHYTEHPSGVECVTIAQEFPYNLGCVIKYVWRAGLKTKSPIEDLKKAAQYIEFEIRRLQRNEH